MMSEPPTRLYLVTPPLIDAGRLPELAAALAAGDVACVLLRLAPMAEREAKDLVRRVGPVVQDRAVALLVEDPRVAAHTGADGAHVSGSADALRSALESLKPERIVGVGGLRSRDDAMRAGEAGPDYLMFGDQPGSGSTPSDTLDRVAWWAEIFNVPCVGVAHQIDNVGELRAAGADFVALGSAVWEHPHGAAAAVADAQARLDRAPVSARMGGEHP